jgi:adsorption protein B
MMHLETFDAIAHVLGWGVGSGILLNQVDELHIDAQYYARGLHRARARAISAADLRGTEKRIAILVPAWREAEVIEQMLDHNSRTLDYPMDNVHFFCGTYPNDSETQGKVDRVARRAMNVHKIVVTHDGPTSKADCLNHVYRGILEEERRSGARFDILLMHDAEDVIHPASLRLYAHLIPRYEFVQTPVFSLPVALGKLVAGTYIDEFAEHHLKDMLVREAIGGLVPSAGVGSAFARDAFEAIASAHGEAPFNVESLTEDYEIGLKFRLAGRRVHFACRTLERVDAPEYIATREYFPDRLRASIRQRSRWILGITLQTWAQVGWKGSVPVLYCLWRDRKALVTNALLLVAYSILLYALVREAMAFAGIAPWSFAALAAPGSLLATLLLANLAAAAFRALSKAYFVGRLNGFAHAAMSAPRLVLANLISIAATSRAVTQYVHHRITKKPLRWLKTTHAFLAPSAQALARPIGAWLIDAGVERAEVERALASQRYVSLRIGEILALTGAARETTVEAALAAQQGIAPAPLDAFAIPLELIRALPEEEAEAFAVVPLAASDAGVLVAAADPLDARARQALAARFAANVITQLADPVAIARTRARAYRRLVTEFSPPPHVRLGERLVGEGRIDDAELREALAVQARTGEPLGEVLCAQGFASIEDVGAALASEVPFRSIRVADVDRTAIAVLNARFCEIQAVAPLRERGAKGSRLLACAGPLHPLVRSTVERRLGEPVSLVLAHSLTIRSALALATAADEGGVLDPAELDVLRAAFSWRLDVNTVAHDARAHARSPIEHLEARGALRARDAAPLRARALGLPLALAASVDAPGLIPAYLASAHGIRVRAIDGGDLVLAAPRPNPEIARTTAAMLPHFAIAWEVLAPAEEESNVAFA